MITHISRRAFLATVAGAAICDNGLASSRSGSDLVRSAHLAGFPCTMGDIPFGTHSHWLQPWRYLCKPQSFNALSKKLGIVVNDFDISQDALAQLKLSGFNHARIEIGWGNVDAIGEASFLQQDKIAGLVRRIHLAGLRPLVLLNANDLWPCPARFSTIRLTKAAAAGDQVLMAEWNDNLIPGRSGLRSVNGSPMSMPFITDVSSGRLSLSKPLSVALDTKSSIQIATLSYEPFSHVGSERNEKTLVGWLRYVDLVASFMAETLGSSHSEDRGFDLEIWNELTFGSAFLDINNYYEPRSEDFDAKAIEEALVRRTVEHAASRSALYRGVQFSDGFGSTIPWPASSREPARVSAISRHPYPPQNSYPNDERAGVALGANMRTTDFVPAYDAYFPEYCATAIQTETICRDLADQPNPVYDTMHGRMARKDGDVVNPVDVWLTEIGCAPGEVWALDKNDNEGLLAKATLRSLFFYTGIGCGRVYIFQANSERGGFGLVNRSNPNGPGLPLLSMRRALNKIQGDKPETNATLLSAPKFDINRTEGEMRLFFGSGSATAPDMHVSDAAVLLPIQVSDKRIAVIYYVMTSDIRKALPAQDVSVSIYGIDLKRFHVTSYDPIRDTERVCNIYIAANGDGAAKLQMTDTPQILLFQV